MQPAILTASEVCEDEDIVLNIQQTYSGSSISYIWYNGTGAVIGNTASLTIAATSVDAVSPYFVEVTVDDCITPISEAISVTVNELPIATATNNGPLCSGSIIQLTAGEISGGTYYWYDGNPQSAPPGTLISTNQNPFIGNLDPGIHDFYLIVENENGCGSTTFAVTQVEIFAEPIISAVSGDGTYCQGSTVTLSAINTVPTGGSMSLLGVALTDLFIQERVTQLDHLI